MSELSAPPGTVWLTQEAHDKLTRELEELTGPERERIVGRIAAAREEGDLRENGGYHAAKDEQGKLEARIRQLQEILRTAQVGEAPASAAGVAGPGMVVTALFQGDAAPTRFLIGSREESPQGMDVFSPQSPLGQAIAGKKPGETVTYPTPKKQMTVEIMEIEPYTG